MQLERGAVTSFLGRQLNTRGRYPPCQSSHKKRLIAETPLAKTEGEGLGSLSFVPPLLRPSARRMLSRGLTSSALAATSTVATARRAANILTSRGCTAPQTCFLCTRPAPLHTVALGVFWFYSRTCDECKYHAERL